jgi:ABC-type uncharacterized transport system ATPase subunit
MTPALSLVASWADTGVAVRMKAALTTSQTSPTSKSLWERLGEAAAAEEVERVEDVIIDVGIMNSTDVPASLSRHGKSSNY